MTTKCVYSVWVSGPESYEVTLKHVKYNTETFKCSNSCYFRFESFTNWEIQTFKISANADIKVRTIRFSILDLDSVQISIKKQLIDKNDLFPERTLGFKEHSHKWVADKFFGQWHRVFVPMEIPVNSIGTIRFVTMKMVHTNK